MAKITVELVKYDTIKTKKRKRANLIVDVKTKEAVVEKLEKIHKGDKIETIHEIVWAEVVAVEPAKEEMVNFTTGKVKFFDREKGYGFIKPDIDMEDLFFHASALGGEDINDNDIVEFEISEGPKGPIAIKIYIMD